MEHLHEFKIIIHKPTVALNTRIPISHKIKLIAISSNISKGLRRTTNPDEYLKRRESEWVSI